MYLNRSDHLYRVFKNVEQPHCRFGHSMRLKCQVSKKVIFSLSSRTATVTSRDLQAPYKATSVFDHVLSGLDPTVIVMLVYPATRLMIVFTRSESLQNIDQSGYQLLPVTSVFWCFSAALVPVAVSCVKLIR